ncbi:MAG TPA: dihydroorotase [Amycolatopsis sp.]|nr:dihydroorotase [Amycolatopsis sp.]
MHVTLRGVRLYGGAAADVGVRDGLLAPPGGRDVDCAGLVALPAFVDLHTHLRDPGDPDAETIATGTAAAAAGGYSDVFAMANCFPVTDTPQRVRDITRVAAETASCRVHPVGAVTVGLAGARLAPLRELAAAGARMFSDDGHCVDDAALLRDALRLATDVGAFVAQHAQHGGLAGLGQINEGRAAAVTGLTPWPVVGEEAIVARDVVLAGRLNARLHLCHISTAGSVEIVRWAKSRGWPVTAEVTPHHLMLDDELAALGAPRYKVNPPLRSAEDVKTLRAALAEGTLDVVATDHAPHSRARKSGHWRDAAFGMIGLETALPVVAEVLGGRGEPDWRLIAESMAHRPAKIAGIDAVAARPLRPGEPATLTLVDPAADWTVVPGEGASRSSNTPFAGLRLRHRVVATLLAGQVTHDALGLFRK